MRLNTKVRYGARAMLELALHYQEGPASLSQIAAAQEISEKYLELLFASLRSAGLVHSQRGARGGYTLARPPEQITLRDIFGALASPEPYVPCTFRPQSLFSLGYLCYSGGLGPDVRRFDAGAAIHDAG